jgi:hypothetical protein
MEKTITDNQTACTIQRQPNSKELSDLAIYLEGMYKGQGNLLPLGKVHLENLWITVKYLQSQKL